MIRLLLAAILATSSIQQHCLNETCWDENATSTESPDGEWTTEIMIASTTSTAVEVATTTEEVSPTNPTPTLPPHIAAVPQDGTICWCDRTPSACDINCCCDKECSIIQKQVFTQCQDASRKGLESHHCYSADLFHKKTGQKYGSERSDFFCVAKDNSKHQKEFPSKSPIKSSKEFNRAVSTRKRDYARSHTIEEKYKTGPYKYLATVWAVTSGKVHPLVIPGLLYGDLCLTTQTIKFLQDEKTSCRLTLPSHPLMCSKAVSATLFKWNIVKILTAPNHINSSNFKESLKNCESQETCIPTRLYHCQELTSQVTCQAIENTDNISKNFACDKSGLEVAITIMHNGTDGVQEVHVRIMITPRKHYLTTSLKFEWNGLKSDSSRGEGTPGYRRGDGILVGKKMLSVKTESNSTRKEEDLETIIDKRTWVTMFQHESGRCSKKRKKVLFGENSVESCVHKVNPMHFNKTGCQEIQTDIYEILLGTKIWTQPTEWIASYSNSRNDDISEWVPILSDIMVTSPAFQNDTGYHLCKNVIRSLFVDIATVKFGSFSSPKNKIIGIMYRLGPPVELGMPCPRGQCGKNNKTSEDILLKTRINFVDLTRPAVVEFARPPGLEAKLPHDFFYPFFSSTTVTPSPAFSLVAMMKTVQIIFL